MTGHEDFKTPGELLQEARRKRGLDLGTIAARTKIPARMLEAIEKDEYHKLSDPLYARSFLQTYARDLGLDPQFVLDQYARLVQQGRGETTQEEVWQEEVEIKRVSAARSGWLWLGIALLVLIVGFLLSRVIGGGSGPGDGANHSNQTVAQMHRQEPAGDGAQTQGQSQPRTQAPAQSRPRSQAEPSPPATVPQEPAREQPPAEASAHGEADFLNPGGQDTLRAAEPVSPAATAMLDQRRQQQATSHQRLPESRSPQRLPEASPREQTQTRPEQTQPEQTQPEQAQPAAPSHAAQQTPPAGTDRTLPPAPAAEPTLEFASGQWPVVLRVLANAQVEITVQQWGQRSAQPIELPAAYAEPVPATGIVMGRPYAAREGQVVYWGAKTGDYFMLRVNRADGVRIQLNGRDRRITADQVGQWIRLGQAGPGRGGSATGERSG
jgi:cytoskeletal protein RodZ